jgi:hypothetical protein
VASDVDGLDRPFDDREIRVPYLEEVFGFVEVLEMVNPQVSERQIAREFGVSGRHR